MERVGENVSVCGHGLCRNVGRSKINNDEKLQIDWVVVQDRSLQTTTLYLQRKPDRNIVMCTCYVLSAAVFMP